MLFRRQYLFFLFVLFAFQAIRFTFVKSVPVSVSSITTDHLGNFYIIKNDVLEKYDRDGKFLRSFSDKKLGAITSVDVTNPMRVVVYYAPFLQVVFLDNTLSLNGTILQLNTIGLQQASLVASSHDNCLWVYDKQNFELLRLNQNMQVIQRSGAITQFLDYSPNPVYLIEQDNIVYLNDPEHGILLFDIYATMYTPVSIRNLNTFQVNDKTILYSKENKLKKYNYKLLTEEEVVLPDSTSCARVEKERLYILKPTEIKIYSFKE